MIDLATIRTIIIVALLMSIAAIAAVSLGGCASFKDDQNNLFSIHYDAKGMYSRQDRARF